MPEMILSEETATAINDLLFPPVRILSKVPGRKRRVLRKPTEDPSAQPYKPLDIDYQSR